MSGAAPVGKLPPSVPWVGSGGYVVETEAGECRIRTVLLDGNETLTTLTPAALDEAAAALRAQHGAAVQALIASKERKLMGPLHILTVLARWRYALPLLSLPGVLHLGNPAGTEVVDLAFIASLATAALPCAGMVLRQWIGYQVRRALAG